MTAQVDHLVVAARSLAEGVAWCEATLGITPGPGGEHTLFGTHNRLFSVASAQFARAYFEVIAVNPGATPEGRHPGKRWFDLDDDSLRLAIAQGPSLVHFVVSTPDLVKARAALHALGIDRGPALHASRMTARGSLEWQITVRPDGQRLCKGTLPTLIQWGGVHPADAMPDSGVRLKAMGANHPQVDVLERAYAAIGLAGVEAVPGSTQLWAELDTPRGLVRLVSAGI